MTDRQTTARLRELSAELLRICRNTGRSQADLAAQLGWSTSRMSRLVQGALGTTPVHVATLLTVCKVKGPEFDRLYALGQQVLERTWLRLPDGNIVADVRSLTQHDLAASRVVEYAPLAIPESLQTESYFRANLEGAGLAAPTVVEDRVRAHRARQNILTESGPRLIVFVSEQALRSEIGPPQVMTAQRQQLVAAASCPHYTVRIVPAAAGPAGMLGAPFRLLEYPGDLPVAQLHLHTATAFLQDPTDISAYRAILARLNALALNQDHSRDLLADVAAM